MRGTGAPANARSRLGAVADHARALLAGAGQEAGRVDEHHQRQPERVAACPRSARPSRPRSASITPPRWRGWLATMPTGRPSMRAKRGDHVARPARRDLEQARRRPTSARDHVAHVVDLARLAGHELAGVAAARARRRARVRGRRPRAGAGGRAARATSAPPRRRRAATRWQTPLRDVHARAAELVRRTRPRRSPPRTTPGPVRNMLAPSVMTTKSVSAGE